MKRLERLTHRVSLRTGVIVFGAMTCLAFSSTSARRAGLLVLAATAVGAASQVSAAAEKNDTAIRAFRVSIREKEIVELRRRIGATRWPTKEIVEDRSQGVQLATLKEPVRYWATDYDWRKAEPKLNAFPQFVTRIDGVDIHFIHVKSRHPNAMPLIMTHGWPGSVIELLETDSLLDSPVGLAAWMLDHDTDSYYKISRVFVEGKPVGNLTRESIVDNITLYWVTGTGASAARWYWETGRAGARGGHFAAWEEPALFVSELRSAFKPLR